MGCYVQTELGHGSNIAAIETPANLDKKTDDWVINSAWWSWLNDN